VPDRAIIGAGLFVGSGVVMADTGPGAFITYALSGVLIIMVMRMLGEMAVANPSTGSFADYSRDALGHWAGFSVGWLYWYFWVVVVGIEAIAGAAIIQLWLPRLEVWEIGLALVAVLTAVNLLSARLFGEFEFWFSSLKVGAIVVFIAIAAAFAFGLGAPAGPTFSNLVSHGGFMPHGWVPMLAGVTSVIFALTGAEIATVAAAESADPARTARDLNMKEPRRDWGDAEAPSV
jgi:GABA permease